jgi:UDP-GlcNAc:undecaprenyl-phosphate GlcNAc-1-phosphate transferase
VTATVALVALPTTVLSTWALLRSPLARRLVAAPTGDRWHDLATPVGGGVAIFLGLLAGVGAAVATTAIPAHRELAGILAGAAIVFLAGLVDDARPIGPVAKVAAQVAAAAVVLAGGVKVEIVSNDVLAAVLAVVWLVAMTNAFNLLDNMDGLAASLAAVAAGAFAIDAINVHPNRMALAVALGLAYAIGAFFFLRLFETLARDRATLSLT